MKASQTKTKEAGPGPPLEDVDRSALAVAGGKAANLGELTRAGFPVPPGFCVTTAAYETVAAATPAPDPGRPRTDAPRTRRAWPSSPRSRETLLDATVPDFSRPSAEAYGGLGTASRSRGRPFLGNG